MQEFVKVYGVGPVTAAKRWICEQHFTSVEEARSFYLKQPFAALSKPARTASSGFTSLIKFGLAFHEDLQAPLRRSDALRFVAFIERLLHETLHEPAARVALVGGFRRGKPTGHDMDILLTTGHETKPGTETALLRSLVRLLYAKGLAVQGTYEERRRRAPSASSPSGPSPSASTDEGATVGERHFDAQQAPFADTMDDLEKWLSIIRFSEDLFAPESWDSSSPSPSCTQTTSTSCTPPRPSSPRQSPLKRYFPTVESPSAPKQPRAEIPLSAAAASSERESEQSLTAAALTTPERSFASLVQEARDPARTGRAIRVDLIAVPASEWAFALLGWTGNGMFNREMRLYAQKGDLHMKVSNTGALDLRTGQPVLAHLTSEEEIFAALKLRYIPPEYRNA